MGIDAMRGSRRVSLLLELELHALAAHRAELRKPLRMLLPSLTALVLLMKAEASDAIAGF